MQNAAYWIDKLELTPHPEGGYYRRTYQSEFQISADSIYQSHGGARHSSTVIHYLLQKGDFSAFHRLKSDEIWFYQLGQTAIIHIIDANGQYATKRLGKNAEKGEALQAIVPAGCWFAAELETQSEFSLMSCMVTPGFDFDDFEMAEKAMLLKKFEKYATVIKRLCK